VKLSLSEISTVGAGFAEDVAAYAAAGFDAIGLWEFKLPDDDGANIALLREHRLGVAVCVPRVPSVLPLAIPGMEGPAASAERVEALRASVSRLAAYQPQCVACLAGALGGRSEEEGTKVLVDALGAVASVARTAGVRVGFEPVHPTQRDAAGFVNSLAHADQILGTVGADAADIGILFDTYHLWDDPGVFEWIAANAGRVAGVHIGDWPSDDRSDRVLPGEGISRTRELVQALAAAGWEGTLDVEIFSTPELFWGLPVDEAARRAHAAAIGIR
jgi:sugar phosphate isomerase/epimerase